MTDVNIQPIPVIIYARKSTDAKLEQEVNSISVQCASARSFIESRKHMGWFALDEELIDNNISGATMKRSGIDRLKLLILEGKVKAVVVNRLDRISRSLSQFLELMAFFDEHSVALVSVTQNINTGDAMGRLMLSIIMSFAEFERELIRDRVTERMHAARKQGRFIGGRPIKGYNIKPEGRELEVDPLEAIQVREIFTLYLKLRSLKETVLELRKRGWQNKQWVTREGKVTGGNEFSVSSLHNLLSNPLYIGKVTLKGKVYEGKQEGIVEPELFEKVKALLSENDVQKGNRRRNSHDAPLKGLLKCKACGTTFVHTGSKKKTKYYRYYTCANKRLNGAHACPSTSIPAGDIENLVIEQLMAIGSNPELQDKVYEQLSKSHSARAKETQTVHRTAKRQLEQITRELTASREFDAPQSLLTHLEQKQQEAENVLQTAENFEQFALPSKDEVIAVVRDMQALWPSFTAAEKCAFVKILVREVEYDAEDGSLTVHFNEDGIISKAQGGAT